MRTNTTSSSVAACTDATLPLEVRIVGALIRLYALSIVRITELTTDRFHSGEDGAYLTLDRNPVLLPPSLAALIEKQISQPRQHSMLGHSAGDTAPFLLPGKPPHRPRNARALHQLMSQPHESARPTNQTRSQHRHDGGRR